MKHFFYAVYVLFYSGAVFMAGIFIGQMVYRARISRRQKAEKVAWATTRKSNGEVGLGEPNMAMESRRR